MKKPLPKQYSVKGFARIDGTYQAHNIEVSHQEFKNCGLCPQCHIKYSQLANGSFICHGLHDKVLALSKIKGIDELPQADANIFKAFLVNFYRGMGPESQRTFVPLQVEVIEDDPSGRYIRFDYKRLGIQCWLHVMGPWKWF